MVLNRFPDGIQGKSFYQKNCPDYAPPWLRTVPMESSSKGKTIIYCLVNNLKSLLWLVNQGCIEMHPWLSCYHTPDYPTALVFDIDPSETTNFKDVVLVAHLLRRLLEGFGLKGYLKTSGASGLHLFVPVAPNYTYAQIRKTAVYLAGLVVKILPDKTTLERNVQKREGKIYIDCFQNARGKTLASVYSVRPLDGAPVSTPVTWKELDSMSSPTEHNMETVQQRISRKGDVFQPVLENKQNLENVLALLS